MSFEHIPGELRGRERWVLWRLEKLLATALRVAVGKTGIDLLALNAVLERLHRSERPCRARRSPAAGDGMKREPLFEVYVTDLVSGERRRATKAELRELHRLWRKHRDIREGRFPRANTGRRHDTRGAQ